jgi:signal transduction histidine kinase
LLRLKFATDVLEESYRKLRELEKVRDDLMKMIVHDLKTPLTTILGTLEMVLDGDFGALTPPAQRALGDADSKGKELLELIQDLLEVARIEEATVALDTSELAPASFLDEIVREWALRLEQEHAQVTVDVAPGLPPIEADRGMLRRVFGNLILNAITHSAQAVRITLSARRDDGHLLFTVADDGPGIPPEYHEVIFRKFEKVKSPAAPSVRSSGLGLAFCKLAVEAHGGRIWVQSAEGRGSQFHIALPERPPAARAVVAGI